MDYLNHDKTVRMCNLRKGYDIIQCCRSGKNNAKSILPYFSVERFFCSGKASLVPVGLYFFINSTSHNHSTTQAETENGAFHPTEHRYAKKIENFKLVVNLPWLSEWSCNDVRVAILKTICDQGFCITWILVHNCKWIIPAVF